MGERDATHKSDVSQITLLARSVGAKNIVWATCWNRSGDSEAVVVASALDATQAGQWQWVARESDGQCPWLNLGTS